MNSLTAKSCLTVKPARFRDTWVGTHSLHAPVQLKFYSKNGIESEVLLIQIKSAEIQFPEFSSDSLQT